MMRFMPETRNNWFDSMFEPFATANNVMKTDIREKDGRYLLDIALPGYKKEDLKISLYNGTLTVAADHNETKEETDAKGRVIRKERYSGSCKRSWYVGDGVKETDIHASYENGVLTLDLPSETKKEEPQEKQITIL